MLRRRLLAASGPSVLGVLAAHQLAYASHDDGHLHGYLALVGPWVAVAALVGWIVARRLASVRLSDVLALQVALLVGMEVGERLVAAVEWAPYDLAAVGSALVVAVGLSVLALGIPGLVHSFALRRAFHPSPSGRLRARPLPATLSSDVVVSPGRSPPISVA